MEVQFAKSTQSQDTLSLDSNECVNLQFDDVLEQPKQPAKETFKVIYGLGNAADRLRLLQEESREAKRLRE